MDLYKVKVSELTDLKEVKKIMRQVKLELDVLEEDLLFCYEMPTKELKNKCQYLSMLRSSLRQRSYELQNPIYSDGTIDLYQDNTDCFSICLTGQKVPVGEIFRSQVPLLGRHLGDLARPCAYCRRRRLALYLQHNHIRYQHRIPICMDYLLGEW